MRKEYDFSKAKQNPHAKRLTCQVTIRLDADTLTYFQALADENGVPHQSLISAYLRDCAKKKKKLSLTWRADSRAARKTPPVAHR